MEVVSKISEKEYIRIVFAMLWSIKGIKFFMAILVLTLILGSYFMLYAGAPGNPAALLFPCCFIVLVWGGSYLSAKKTFKSDRRISETIRYVFEDNEFSVYGESFSSNLSWDKVHKVTRTRNWLLVWQNNVLANPIPMISIDEFQLNYLRGVLNTNNVPHKI